MSEKEEISLDLNWAKKLNWTYVLLALFIILGIYLRAYHADFPSIGYHNMKENEYLDQAYNFMTTGDFAHRVSFAFYGLDERGKYFEEYGQMPGIPYLLTILWSVLGQHLWVARFLIIAFFMAATITLFFLVKKLTNNTYLSLLSSFLMTIMPLGIYFGRNVQPESPALFFSLLSMFFFIKWVDDKNHKDLFFASLFLGIAGLFKYTFLIFAIPILVMFPYKGFINNLKHKHFKDLTSGIMGWIPFGIGVIVYEYLLIQDRTKLSYPPSGEFLMPLSLGYWTERMPILISFIKDNFTLWFFWIAIIGCILVAIKHKTKLGKFLVGLMLIIPIYIMMNSGRFAGHAYYQMPFLPLVCIASAYALYIVGTITQQLFKNKFALYLPLLIILLAIPEMQAANDRVFGTVFYGQDFLGEYLKTRMQPDERIAAFAFSQDMATCSYAKHQCGWATNLTDFQNKEKMFDFKYLYVGTANLPDLFGNSTMWEYIKNNYEIVFIGFIPNQKQLTPTHFVLKRGGKFDTQNFINKNPQLAKEYDMKFGKVPYYYLSN